MAYIIGQYNKSPSTNSMTVLTNGEVGRISATTSDGTGFEEECLLYRDNFIAGTTYYFHGKIKKLVDRQIFNIQLMNNESFNETQLIKILNIEGGPEGWLDVEFLFTPIKNFNNLAFILNRTAKDSDPAQTRYPVIIYEELSRVNNLLPSISSGIPLIKAGIQGIPGLITSINQEEIRLGRSGIYEFNNGLLKIDFFSVVGAGNMTIDIDEVENEIDAIYSSEILKNRSLSKCLFDKVGLRNLSDFSLDYIYEKEV